MEPQLQTEQKTRTHVAQGVGIALVTAAGAAAAAAFLFFGTQSVKTETSGSVVKTNTNKSLPVTDLSTAVIPPKELLVAADSTTNTLTLDPAVSVKITSPTEGAAVDGNTSVNVELTDPSHKAVAVRVLLYGDLLPGYLQGVSLGNDTTPPYTFSVNYGLYPSGEYRYVAQAVKFDPTIPGADQSVPIAVSDTMVTWVRTCYYLGYQDMTFTGSTGNPTPGSTITFTGTVKNNMRGNCKNVYELRDANPIATDQKLPVGWTATFSPALLDLGIGETKPFTMSVRIPANATAGTYKVWATSVRQMTGFIVSKSVDVKVNAQSGGGGTQRLPE